MPVCRKDPRKDWQPLDGSPVVQVAREHRRGFNEPGARPWTHEIHTTEASAVKKSDALGMRSKVAVIEDYQPIRGQVIDSGSHTGVPV